MSSSSSCRSCSCSRSRSSRRFVRGRAAVVAALFALGLGGGVVACAGASGQGPGGETQGAAGKDGGAAKGASPGAAAASSAPAEKPFAATAVEATQLISAAIDKRTVEMNKCISEYRARKNLPHERVEVSVGIDQDGRLLGATLKKGKPDPALSDCMMAALAGAPFPKSHSGVITMTKSYEDIVQ